MHYTSRFPLGFGGKEYNINVEYGLYIAFRVSVMSNDTIETIRQRVKDNIKKRPSSFPALRLVGGAIDPEFRLRLSINDDHKELTSEDNNKTLLQLGIIEKKVVAMQIYALKQVDPFLSGVDIVGQELISKRPNN